MKQYEPIEDHSKKARPATITLSNGNMVELAKFENQYAVRLTHKDKGTELKFGISFGALAAMVKLAEFLDQQPLPSVPEPKELPKVNPYDAPMGHKAVVGGSCGSCAFKHNIQGCYGAPDCTAPLRKDKCDVIFVKLPQTPG